MMTALRLTSTFVDWFERDSIKNLFALKGMDKSGLNVMLNAHMDEVGLYVTHITKEGYLHIGKAGGIDERLLLGKKVLVGKDRFPSHLSDFWQLLWLASHRWICNPGSYLFVLHSPLCGIFLAA